MTPEVEIDALSPQNAELLRALFAESAQCSECWCMNHRCPDGAAPVDVAAREAFFAGVQAGEIHGVVARAAGDAPQALGWCAVDPLATQVGHDYLLAGREAEPGDWAIHCLFVHPAWRGRKLSTLLVTAAERYAREHGAQRLLAFPIPEAARDTHPAHDAEFSGRYSTYAKAGYQALEPLDDFYAVVAKPLVTP